VDLDQLQDLIRIFEASGLAEIEMEEEGRKICLRKPCAVPQAAPIPLVQQPMVHPAPVVMAPGAAAPMTTPAEQAPEQPDTSAMATIDSPMVGVFYAAPAPGEDPFVKAGDRISVDQTVCIVEAMKLMNEVTAKESAVIDRVLVENGEPVEYGQPLFAIRPLD
jgi:oxaloacetate decarboxylase (Na+ extruding) subunit alpha